MVHVFHQLRQKEGTAQFLRFFVGFAGSHGVNYFLHIVLFNLFLFLGVHRLVAPPLVMGVAMLVQFTILKLVFSRWGKRKEKSLP